MTKTQIQKDQIIIGLVETRQNILLAAAALPPETQNEIFLGTWSAFDLIAHLIGWDLTNIKAIKAVLASRLPDFYNHQDRDWKTYNDHLVTKYKKADFEALLQSARDSHQELIDFIKTVPDKEFNKDYGVRFKGYKVTIGRLLKAELDDEKKHYEQIENFRQQISNNVIQQEEAAL